MHITSYIWCKSNNLISTFLTQFSNTNLWSVACLFGVYILSIVVSCRSPGKYSQYSVWLWTGRPGDRGSIPGRAKDFSSSLCAQTGSGAHPASCPMDTGGPFPGAWRWPLTPIWCKGQEWVGAILPLPQSVPVECSGTALLLLSVLCLVWHTWRNCTREPYALFLFDISTVTRLVM
jgi:hypothetical protein